MMMVTVMIIYVINLNCILVMWDENKYILSYISIEIILGVKTICGGYHNYALQT
jgi:hypothetical protein